MYRVTAVLDVSVTLRLCRSRVKTCTYVSLNSTNQAKMRIRTMAYSIVQ